MFPVIYRVLSRYAPFVTLPFAAVIGFVGYNLESYLSDKYTPYQESISKQRTERLLASGSTDDADSLKEKKFVPTTIFERNLSPSLQDHEKK